MPYISKNLRSLVDPTIDQLHQEIIRMEMDNEMLNTEGVLNYIITKLLMKVYSSPSYKEINDAIGMLESCKLEYYRKVASGYEDQKMYENGGVMDT
jgi:hypothetical protein